MEGGVEVMARGRAEIMAGCRRGGGRCPGGNGCVGGGRGSDCHYVNDGGWGREKGRHWWYRW